MKEKKQEFLWYLKQSAYICPQLKQKDNENNARKYILVAPVTTPTVVREQRSYVYM